MKKSLSLFFFIIFCTLVSRTQVTIILQNADSFPDSIKNNIFVAGNFNNWDPGNTKYKLKNTNGVYSITFTPKKSTVAILFKFTRGSWDKVEANSDGSERQNRVYEYGDSILLKENVDGWDDLIPDRPIPENSKVLQFGLYDDSLKRLKNIRVYLPCDYMSSDKRYPVVYMLDGQNLFDQTGFFLGTNWGIDGAMDSVCASHLNTSIIVGIDHAGVERLDEYSPYKIKKMDAGGEGDAFAQFVVNILKPKIDSMYRTLPDRDNTAIGGSSLGGLMSLYMVLNYNNTFSKAAVFSPSLWTNEKNFRNAEKYDSALPTKIYFVMGAREGGKYDYMFDMQKMYNILLKKQLPELQLRFTIESDGQHREMFWRSEFFDAYMWLME